MYACFCRAILLMVKSSREQALIQRWQHSIPCHGFRKGILKLNIFIPNSSISFRDLCSLSGYLESLLHVPQQQCLVLTILSEIRRLKPFFWNENFAYIPSISPRTRWCLSESRGGSKSMQSIFRPRALRYSSGRKCTLGARGLFPREKPLVPRVPEVRFNRKQTLTTTTTTFIYPQKLQIQIQL